MMQAFIGNSTRTTSRTGDPTEAMPDRGWSNARDCFLTAVDETQRAFVAAQLRQRRGAIGLRMWLRTLVTRGKSLPRSLPTELVQVYLEDSEALPLHDCAGCGLAIPIRPGWQDYEGEPQRVYFPSCPCCGERTGLFAYWSNTTRP